MVALSSENLSIIILQTIFLFTSYFIPAFCITILTTWLGEEQRMIRIGKYLLRMEENINKKLDEKVLNWESHIREKSESIKYPEIFILVLFLGLSLTSILFGHYILYNCGHYINKLLSIISIIFYIILLIILFYILKKFNKYQKEDLS